MSEPRPRWAFWMPTGDTPAGATTLATPADGAVRVSTDLDDPGQVILPPEGLGNPQQTTEDVSYPRRDGAVHYDDWYEPRIVTLPDVLVRCPGGACPSDLVVEERRNLVPKGEPSTATGPSAVLPYLADVGQLRSVPITDRTGLPPVSTPGAPVRAFRVDEQSLLADEYWVRLVEMYGLNASLLTFTVSGYWRCSPGFIGIPYAEIEVATTESNVWGDPGPDRLDAMVSQWTRYEQTFTVPPGDSGSYISWGATLPGAGPDDWLEVTGLQVEVGASATPYQDPFDRPLVPSLPLVARDVSACVVEHVNDVTTAWRRRFEDVEAWLTVNGTGPYAVVGRPRVADVDWLDGYRDAAQVLLRFDCADQRLYLLDVDGEGNVVGDGRRQVTVRPAPDVTGGRYYPRIYGEVRDGNLQMAYEGGQQEVLVEATNAGRVEVPVVVEFTGLLRRPRLQNLTTGAEVELAVDVPATGQPPVRVDTGSGRVTVGGASRFGWTVGNPRLFTLVPGVNVLRLVDADPVNATGRAVVSWRAAV